MCIPKIIQNACDYILIRHINYVDQMLSRKTVHMDFWNLGLSYSYLIYKHLKRVNPRINKGFKCMLYLVYIV